MDPYAAEVDRRIAQLQSTAQRYGDTFSPAELEKLRDSTREQIVYEHEPRPRDDHARFLDDQERDRKLEQERQRQLDRDDPSWTRD